MCLGTIKKLLQQNVANLQLISSRQVCFYKNMAVFFPNYSSEKSTLMVEIQL
jgi:hypothetical protein